ncbi:MAG: hypothetical protein PHR45_00765 [Muribaculaceae bacterium]|nr:hypothetical protein [Muribaculaceae bacterium]
MKISIKLFCIAFVSFFCVMPINAKKDKTNSNGEVEIVQLCNFHTDEVDYFANGIAESSDMQMTKDKAINAARAELANMLTVSVENFTKRYRRDVNDQLDQKTEDRLQLATNQTIRGSLVICDKLTRTNTGKYRAYVTVKLSKTAVTEAIKSTILENEELKLNFDQAQFDKVADEAIANAE